jgi:hypothetical protein
MIPVKDVGVAEIVENGTVRAFSIWTEIVGKGALVGLASNSIIGIGAIFNPGQRGSLTCGKCLGFGEAFAR